MRLHRFMSLLCATTLLGGCHVIEAALPGFAIFHPQNMAPKVKPGDTPNAVVCDIAAPDVLKKLDVLQKNVTTTLDGFDTTLRKLPAEIRDNAAARILLRGARLHTARAQHDVASLVYAKMSQPSSLREQHTANERRIAQLESTGPLNEPNFSSGLLTEHDFRELGKLFTQHILRKTKGTPPTPATLRARADEASPAPAAPAAKEAEEEKFWEGLTQYFKAFYQGEFVNYFDAKVDKPAISLTITDAELVNALVVFMEYVLDDALNTPVWYKGTAAPKVPADAADKATKYFPGNTQNQPTSLAVFGRQPVKLVDGGCGINEAKATVVGLLAQQFGTAASTEVGLIVGSIGGINGGAAYNIGLLGKLSIGDNKLFISLIEAAVAELAARWTVQLTYPVLAHLDFSAAEALAKSVATGSQPPPLHLYTAPFQAPTSRAVN